MSNYNPAPQQPDGRIFASYPMPAKIDLVQETPRRESLVEQQLEKEITLQQTMPKIEVTELKTTTTTTAKSNIFNHWNNHQAANNEMNVRVDHRNLASINHHFANTNNTVQQQQQLQQQQPQLTGVQTTIGQQPGGPPSAKDILNNCVKNNAANLAAELAEKEAKLMADINALHQRPYSPFSTPAKIDLTMEQRRIQQQYAAAPQSPRPQSRASSAASDLLDKEAKLLQEIDEIERKPYNPQTMVIEREQWFEYPEGRPYDRQLTDSKRRVRDFCSLPSHMYQQDRHVHEENLPLGQASQSPTPGSIHTTIIRSPKREIDNKSPLPFAFDNFTTKGVRGNIASVGAIEPDRPRPPIYPILKRSPTPSMSR